MFKGAKASSPSPSPSIGAE
jgi:hypothetical protein